MTKYIILLFATLLTGISAYAQQWHLTSTHNTDFETRRAGTLTVSIDIDSLELKLRMNEKNYYHDIISVSKEGSKLIYQLKMNNHDIIGVLDKKNKTFEYLMQITPNRIGTHYVLDTMQEILPPISDSARRADSLKKISAAKKIWDVDDTTAEAKPAEDTTVYDAADKMPEYPGGKTAMDDYLKKHVHYPKEAREDNKRGFVELSVVIEKNGKIGPISVTHSLCDECNAEAIRAVKSMPIWQHGSINDEAKRIRVKIPVNFFPDVKVKDKSSQY